MAEHLKNKEKLVTVAIELFSTRGFKGTSIRDIANAMDMSISNIYHYFGNKEGLLLAVLEHASKGLVEKLGEIPQMDLDPLERFKLLIRTHIQLSEFYKKEIKIFFLDEEHLSPEGIKINNQTQTDILQIHLKALNDLKKAGYLQCKSATIAAFNILGIINWQLRWYRTDGSLTLEDVSREIVSFILHGILGSNPPGIESDS
ncbi:TetR family transcriptional regulator [Desulfobacula sp.]|uniref:TetR/AcrR family transcriptional regulator n=1 Tax=Desulfobacula sp. TaxID=2593537 RepID=UPI0026279916|nr:TetR family transcriptional regulator [Desulfobacula sp.]